MAALHTHERPAIQARYARGPLRLRLTLAMTAFVLASVGAIVLAVLSFATETNEDAGYLRLTAVICAIVAVISFFDASIVRRRIRRGDL